MQWYNQLNENINIVLLLRGVFMFWLVFWLLVCVAILAYGIRRMANHDYRFGSGLFKSSENNLDEKDEFVDKDYYDKNNLFK